VARSLEAAPPDEIDAGPVRLRRWRVDDAAVLARLVTANLAHLGPWLAWAREPPTEEEEREFLQRMHAAWVRRTDFGYGLLLPDVGLTGAIGLHARQRAGTLEIGYWIAAASTGRGYVTAAARALTDAAFALPGAEWVEIRCDEANVASAAIPRRLGYRLVDVVPVQAAAPAEAGRHMVWAVERGDWPTAAASG